MAEWDAPPRSVPYERYVALSAIRDCERKHRLDAEAEVRRLEGEREAAWNAFRTELEDARSETSLTREKLTTLRHTTLTRVCAERDQAIARAEQAEQALEGLLSDEMIAAVYRDRHNLSDGTIVALTCPEAVQIKADLQVVSGVRKYEEKRHGD
jgi:hypothetical protein